MIFNDEAALNVLVLTILNLDRSCGVSCIIKSGTRFEDCLKGRRGHDEQPTSLLAVFPCIIFNRRVCRFYSLR